MLRQRPFADLSPWAVAVTIAQISRNPSEGVLLPAIQRECVWDANQIRRVLDSLFRSYPIGSFLLGSCIGDGPRSSWYDFVTYHERDHPYAAKATAPGKQIVTAILDGEQRLTAPGTPLTRAWAALVELDFGFSYGDHQAGPGGDPDQQPRPDRRLLR